MSNNKRIARNTLMLYFRMLLTMAVTLYTSRVVLNALGVEDYGIYNVVGGVVTMLSFLNAAMSSGTQRYLSFAMGKGDLLQLRKVFSASLSIHIIIAVIILILAETVGLWFLNTQLTIPYEKMTAANWVYQFSILTFMVSVTQVPYNAAIIANERMSAYAYVSIIEVLLKLLIVYLLVALPFNKLELYSVLMFTVSFIIAMTYRIYCLRHFAETHYRFAYDKSLWKELASYAGWNLWGNLAAVGFTQGINILLNIFFGPTVNAARAIAYQVSGAIMQFVGNFQLAVNPQITKNYANGNQDEMTKLIYRSSKFSFLLLFVLAMPILFNTEYILTLWLKNVPQYTVIFCQLVIINALIESFSGPLMIAAQATGKIKVYQSTIGGLLLLNVPISYIVLRLNYPPQATLYVMIIISLLAFVGRLIILKHLIKLNIGEFCKQVIMRPSILLTMMYVIAQYTTMNAENITQFLIQSSFIGSVSLLAVFLVGLSLNERLLLLQQVNTFKTRLIR
ncbi:MAG: MATE family efflux transporter [Marinifilaceae bacterium]